MSVNLKGLVTPEKMHKKSFNLKDSVNKDLSLFQDFLEDEHATPVSQQDLLASIVETFLANRSDFKKWRKKKDAPAEKETTPEIKPGSFY